MASISEIHAVAMAHHRAGRLESAESLYREILHTEPTHADTWHLLGLVHGQKGNNEITVECIRRALAIRPDWPEALTNLGNALNAQGEFSNAVACLERALELNPQNATAHNNLGNALRDQGKRIDAITCYRRALELNPSFAEAHNNLGRVLSDQGEWQDAVACYRRAIELKPDYASAYLNLAAALRQLGEDKESIALYRRTITLQPNFAPTYNNLGNALRHAGDLFEAVASYRRALELKPDYATAHNNLGIGLFELGRPDDAIASYRRALALQPDFAEVHNNLGNSLVAIGSRDDALAHFRRALELKPEFPEALYNLGNSLKDLGNRDDAIASYRRALELNPRYADVHTNLGNALKDQGNLAEAISCHRRALALNPEYAEAHNNLGNAFRDQGNINGALDCYRRALELKPDCAVAHSNLLNTLLYCPNITSAALADAHARYDRQHAAPLYSTSSRCLAIPEAPDHLRLGFVSPDLGRHPVGYFLVRLLENTSAGPHETICYSDRIIKDDLTHRLQKAATHWRDVNPLGDDRLAEQIRADRIDILFDLAGHTAHNRLLVFARRPAPMQITWIGYEGTTGLGSIDYLLADRLMVPLGSERHYREKVLRMPDGYLCYDPPDGAPPVGPLPLLKNGYTTFGSFNNLAKITPDVVSLWSSILERLRTARLIMKYRGLGDSTVRQRFIDLFAARGIEPTRLELCPWSSYSDYLATYQQVDIALDPFPFSGSTVTCESLWMGVPVITCPGDTFASRHSFHHLTRVGLAESIAHDLDEYLELAVRLGRDPTRLSAIRSGLRERMADSSLCDGKRFAADWILLLQNAWALLNE